MAKYNFCTLFDSAYLTRGLAMYESLSVHCKKFHLYIFAFDDLSFETLVKLDLEHATIISLEMFEDETLKRIKQERTKGEYCWTCTPFVIRYAIERFGLEHCTYLDADVYFFSDPSVLVNEMQNASVLITEHRYTPMYDQSATSGIYCVQFVTFKNDERGIKVLSWWQNACSEWCFARYEDGKFGDQMYLDHWTSMFDGVHVLRHLGGGVAPWNIQQYTLVQEGSTLYGIEKKTYAKFEVIFYHFHALRFLNNDQIELSVYRLSQSDRMYLYKPYVRHLEMLAHTVGEQFVFLQKPVSVEGYTLLYMLSRLKEDWLLPLKFFYRKLFSRQRIFDKKSFIA